MNFDVSTNIENVIKNKVIIILNDHKVPELPENIVATDNIGEVIEKLCILHIRTWFLEDAAGVAKTDEELASIKRKIDICFKQKRPQYIQAINAMIDAAIKQQRSLLEDSVKLYKGN